MNQLILINFRSTKNQKQQNSTTDCCNLKWKQWRSYVLTK